MNHFRLFPAAACERLAFCAVMICIALFCAPFSALAEHDDYDDKVIHERNVILYEREDLELEEILGIPETYHVDVKDVEYDEFGRPSKIYVYDIDTDEFLGKYTITYDNGKYYIDGVYAGKYEFLGEMADESASEVAAEEVTQQSSRTTKRILGKRIAAVMAPRPAGAPPRGIDQQDPNAVSTSDLGYSLGNQERGMAAGDEPNRWGAWVNGAVTKMANYSDDQQFDGAMATSLAGLDYKPTDFLIFGVAAGYEYTALGTGFNNGEFHSNGLTVAPYAAWAILETLVWDVTGAFTWLANDTARDVDLLDYRADYYSFRSMVSTTLNWYHLIGNWSLNANSGFMYANEYTPEYTEKGILGLRNTVGSSNSYVGEFSWGARLGYLFPQMEPYVAVSYLWDPWMSGPSGQDNDEFEASVGVNLMASRSFLVTFELTNSFFREYVQNTTFMTSLRYEF